ncbi:MAG TPA: diguanylate cyclase [Thermoleophilaceae bacterium]|nr:diguanylate cyclase [Thermoleophilaceae bacterium]
MIAASAAAVVAATAWSAGPTELDIALLVAAVVVCAAGNFFEVFAPAHFSFQPNLAFFFAAALLLPPWAVAALAVVCFAPGWVLHRVRWYMATFNIANYVLAGLAAREVAAAGDALSGGAPDLAGVIALAAAAVTFVVVNHLLIVVAVTLSRGVPLRKTLDEMLACLPVDTALATTGGCLAVLWAANPPLAALAAGPMALIHRALWVPLLEHKSRTDSKTGLYNSEHFTRELDEGLARADRRGLPLSMLMIDLDRLRAVNNVHGHLAGDRLIRGVAELVARLGGHSGVAARFGGDELSLLLPDTDLDAARAVAENIRRGVQALEIPADGNHATMRSSVSVGIATFPEHGANADALLKSADAAVYDAKLGGRNRIRIALPPAARAAFELESPSGQDETPNVANMVLPDEEALMAELPAEGPTDAHTPPAERSARWRRLIPWYVGGLCLATLAVAALSDHVAIGSDLTLFGLLVLSVVVLDVLRLDVFERATISPATVPNLALAAFFGPLGPIAAEVCAAGTNVVRRKPSVKTLFDFGALSLAGAAAAVTFDAVPTDTRLGILAASAAAGFVYYLVNIPLLAVVMGLEEGTHPKVPFKEGLAWLWPQYPVFGVVAGTFVISETSLGLFAFFVFGLPVAMLWVAEKQYLARARSSVAELRSSHGELEQTNAQLMEALDENQRLLGRMHRSYLSTITSLARTIEAKDPYTGDHTERVAELALLLAEELGFVEPDLRAIRVGALVHDIGKIGVPDSVLLKPGVLNQDELLEIKRHPEISSYILAELELPPIVKQMVRSHHERWDGAGYPDQLEGDEIPLAARILSVADALDAMTSDRPYRKAMPLPAALDEICEQAGAQFCPQVAAALERCLERRMETHGWHLWLDDVHAPSLSGAV